MPNFSDWSESGILNLLFRSNTNSFGAPALVAVALCSGVPAESNTGATIPELPNTNGYTRITLNAPSNATWSEVSQNPSSSGTIANSNQITFAAATGDWGMVSGVALVTSNGYGSGNVLVFGALQTPRDVKNTDVFSFSAAALNLFLG